ncbi:MAG: Hsp33 family molecular chaperone HslO [Oligoflexia bacterium]|nr:Hsp33 family molecular chaperone HslO [Oligoflexia bacterium]
MSDLLQKCVSKNQDAVVYAIDATALVQETMERVGTWPTATNHLGQALMGAALIQALNDKDGHLDITFQWMCAGPFGHVYTDAKNFGELRGTISNPKADVDSYEVGLGTGVLQVKTTRSLGGGTSIVDSKGSVSEDLVEYLEKSEQKNCGLNLSVLIAWNEDKTNFRVKSALGYLVHILPQQSTQRMNELLLSWDQHMKALGPISKWVLNENHRTTEMLRFLCAEEHPKIVMDQRITFRCNCDEQRAKRALALLEHQEDLEGQNNHQNVTEIRCEFCGKIYEIKAPPIKRKKK